MKKCEEITHNEFCWTMFCLCNISSDAVSKKVVVDYHVNCHLSAGAAPIPPTVWRSVFAKTYYHRRHTLVQQGVSIQRTTDVADLTLSNLTLVERHVLISCFLVYMLVVHPPTMAFVTFSCCKWGIGICPFSIRKGVISRGKLVCMLNTVCLQPKAWHVL